MVILKRFIYCNKPDCKDNVKPKLIISFYPQVFHKTLFANRFKKSKKSLTLL